jgi:regulator of RNase E activity RraB
MTTTTDLASKCDILTDIWTNHFENEFFEDFIEIYDLGFPMAYFISNGIVEATPLAIELIDATFEELLRLFEYEDEGFTTLEDFWGFG